MDQLIFCGYEFASAFVPGLIVFLVMLNKRGKRDGWNNIRAIALSVVLIVYITGIYHFTGAGTLYEGMRYGFDGTLEYNVIPFSKNIDIVGYALNILLFIPLGILLPIMNERNKRFKALIIWAIGFSVMIELSQILNHRATDIDDLLLNILGAAIGYGVYYIFNKVTSVKLKCIIVPNTIICAIVVSTFLGRFLLYNDMGLARILYDF